MKTEETSIKSKIVSSDKKTNSKFSIKSALKEEKIVKEDIESLPRADFSNEQLTALWQQFLSVISNQITPSTLNAIKEISLEKSKTDTVRFTSPSFTIQEEFASVRNQFNDLAKKTLNNFHIQLVFDISNVESESSILSNEQIYTKMVEKNKDIDKLRVELGLDFFE